MDRILSLACCLLAALAGGDFLCVRRKSPTRLRPKLSVATACRRGRLIQGSYGDSRIYPGTQRDYWVYIPAQLPPDKPAPLMVFQDGKSLLRRKPGEHGRTSCLTT